VIALLLAALAATAPGPWQLHLRQRDGDRVVERQARWAGPETAVIVVDMWDHHWCTPAETRVARMIPRMNAVLAAVRARGGLVVHAPSDTMSFYAETPQRRRAQQAPAAAPVPAGGDKWVYLDPKAEGPLPIDDSDGGCDCADCKAPKGAPWPWRREHPDLTVAPDDVVSDRGREIYNVLRARAIKHVLFVGVHTNMCVLGRPFGIRQMVRWGFDVGLVRDLTDGMYNPQRAPHVSHQRGVDLVIEHIERHWCPTVASGDLVGASQALQGVQRVLEVRE
jgi:nicotinamidase-related amidase